MEGLNLQRVGPWKKDPGQSSRAGCQGKLGKGFESRLEAGLWVSLESVYLRLV